jgi:hypothetical protein
MKYNSVAIVLFSITILSQITPLIVNYYKYWKKNKKKEILKKENKEYIGYCHCKAIKFKVKAPKHLVVWDCNCSICYLKKNFHFIVPKSCFELLEGEEVVTEYKFNTKTAKHIFCKFCGVQSFYIPRSNPDGVAVTFACIPAIEVVTFFFNRNKCIIKLD